MINLKKYKASLVAKFIKFMKKLVISIIVPPSRKVPPFYGYGGSQRGAYDLVEELKNMGHEIILFAPRDSETSADRLISPTRGTNDPPPITDERKRRELVNRYRNKIIEVLSEKPDIDIINLRWDDERILEFIKDLDAPLLYSLHNPASKFTPKMLEICKEYSIQMSVHCESHKKQYTRLGLRNIEVVYYGMDVDLYPYSQKALVKSKEKPKLDLLCRLKEDGADYLLSIGRIAPHKGQYTAIQVVRKTKEKLIIVGKPFFLDKRQTHYFNSKIRPNIDEEQIFYIENVNEEEKKELMKFAKGLLFPAGIEDPSWEEPFGRVLMESLSCGTPVIAYNKASSPEIIAPEVGHLVNDIEEMVEAVSRIEDINRGTCRKYAERRFKRSRMARDYLRLYERISRR